MDPHMHRPVPVPCRSPRSHTVCCAAWHTSSTTPQSNCKCENGDNFQESAPSLCTWLRCFTNPVLAPTSFSTYRWNRLWAACRQPNSNNTADHFVCLEVFHCLSWTCC